MKKTIILLAAICLVIGAVGLQAYAEGTFDFTQMSTEQIIELMDHASSELTKRTELIADENVLFSQDGFTIILTEATLKESAQNEDKLTMNLLVINDTDVCCQGYEYNFYVNGWRVNGYASCIGNIDPHSKGRNYSFAFYHLKKDADITELSQIEYAKLRLTIKIGDERSFETEPITLVYSEECGLKVVSR